MTGPIKKRLDKNGEKKKGKSLILLLFSFISLLLGSQPAKKLR